MNRTFCVSTAVIVVFTIAAHPTTATGDTDDAEASRPNILFCLADNHSWPHMGATGNRAIRTPAFDRIAREGALFTHAFSCAASCTPSRSGILTAGIRAILLGTFYWIIDVRQYRKRAFPLVVIGLNPLTIYVAQRLFYFRAIADVFVHGFISYCGALEPIVWAICVLSVKWLFLYFLFRQKVFLRA